ncbi:FAD dependent oxidoreductase-domain-containing protein [Lipomyces tetrasporus]
MSLSKSAPIAIIGAGRKATPTFPSLKGIPSPPRYSAAFDLNKIVRAEYEDPFYADLALEAINAWKTPLYRPHYHQTGYLLTTSATAPVKAKETLQRSFNSISNNPQFKGKIIPVNGPDDIRNLVWQYDGPLTGWTGYFNRLAGYAHSSNALVAVYRAALARGVKFFLGEHGAVQELIYSNNSRQKCRGLRTKDGRVHEAAVTIVAAGAYGSNLIPEASKQIVARSWSVAHVKLTDEETSALRGIPVTYARDIGIFFEPDPKTNLLKLCPMGCGYTNISSEGISVPPPSLADRAFIPVEDEEKMRKLLRETLPALADRPFVDKKLCWFADSKESDFIIDFVANSQSSLVFLSGDSGHGFKMLPIFGKWVQTYLNLASISNLSYAGNGSKMPDPRIGGIALAGMLERQGSLGIYGHPNPEYISSRSSVCCLVAV